MNEFDLIDRIVTGLGCTRHSEDIVIGPGDDAAVVRMPQGEDLVSTQDVCISGVHFPEDCPGNLAGYRAVAVNISDLASMGAKPLFMTIAVTMDGLSETWLDGFIEGVRHAAQEYQCPIAGGNLARGHLAISISANGSVLREDVLLRSTALEGDAIWVTGTLGATTIAKQREFPIPTDSLQDLMNKRDDDPVARYFLPHARVDFAHRARHLIHGCIDISDGLGSELNHLSSCSLVGATIDLNCAPVWDGLNNSVSLLNDDSYELLFTSGPDDVDELTAIARESSTPLSRIGEIQAGKELFIWQGGRRLTYSGGFKHFSDEII